MQELQTERGACGGDSFGVRKSTSGREGTEQTSCWSRGQSSHICPDVKLTGVGLPGLQDHRFPPPSLTVLDPRSCNPSDTKNFTSGIQETLLWLRKPKLVPCC